MSDKVTNIRIAAAAIVNEKRQVLVVRKRGTAAFMQPGGKIEPDETNRNALARELSEELGLRVDPEELRPLGDYIAPAANEPGATLRAALYLLEFDFAPTPNREIAEARWISIDRPGDIKLAPLTEHHVLPLLRDRLS